MSESDITLKQVARKFNVLFILCSGKDEKKFLFFFAFAFVKRKCTVTGIIDQAASGQNSL